MSLRKAGHLDDVPQGMECVLNGNLNATIAAQVSMQQHSKPETRARYELGLRKLIFHTLISREIEGEESGGRKLALGSVSVDSEL